MILFISSWHLVALVALCGGILGFAAFLAVAGLLGAVRGDYAARTTAGKLKHEKRSAAAKQGWTREEWLEFYDALVAERRAAHDAITPDDEVERVLRQLDEQAEAKAK